MRSAKKQGYALSGMDKKLTLFQALLILYQQPNLTFLTPFFKLCFQRCNFFFALLNFATLCLALIANVEVSYKRTKTKKAPSLGFFISQYSIVYGKLKISSITPPALTVMGNTNVSAGLLLEVARTITLPGGTPSIK